MAVYNLLINNSPMNLFNKISDVNFGTNLYNESWIPLNVYIDQTIKSMDWIIGQTLLKDIEIPSVAVPYVRVSMIVEILSTEKSKFLEVGLNSL